MKNERDKIRAFDYVIVTKSMDRYHSNLSTATAAAATGGGSTTTTAGVVVLETPAFIRKMCISVPINRPLSSNADRRSGAPPPDVQQILQAREDMKEGAGGGGNRGDSVDIFHLSGNSINGCGGYECATINTCNAISGLHLGVIVSDQQTGDDICTLCGLATVSSSSQNIDYVSLEQLEFVQRDIVTGKVRESVVVVKHHAGGGGKTARKKQSRSTDDEALRRGAVGGGDGCGGGLGNNHVSVRKIKNGQIIVYDDGKCEVYKDARTGKVLRIQPNFNYTDDDDCGGGGGSRASNHSSVIHNNASAAAAASASFDRKRKLLAMASAAVDSGAATTTATAANNDDGNNNKRTTSSWSSNGRGGNSSSNNNCNNVDMIGKGVPLDHLDARSGFVGGGKFISTDDIENGIGHVHESHTGRVTYKASGSSEYKTDKYFEDHMKHAEGNDRAVPDSAMNKVRMYLWQHQIPRECLTPLHVQETLKTLRMSTYYNQSVQIWSRLAQRTTIKIAPDHRLKLSRQFSAICAQWNTFRKSIKRIYLYRYSLILHILCVLNGYNEYVHMFPVLVNKAKLRKQIKQEWPVLLDQLGWIQQSE